MTQKSSIRRLSSIIGLSVILASGAARSQDAYFLYDDFAGTQLDRSLWQEADLGDPYVTNGTLVMSTPDSWIGVVATNLNALSAAVNVTTWVDTGDHVEFRLAAQTPSGKRCSIGMYASNLSSSNEAIFCQVQSVTDWTSEFFTNVAPALWGMTYDLALEYTTNKTMLAKVNGTVVSVLQLPEEDDGYSKGASFELWSGVLDHGGAITSKVLQVLARLAYSSPLVGALDTVADGVAEGWTYDPDAPSDSIEAYFFVDGMIPTGTFAGAVSTLVPRPDVNEGFGITGVHGFRWPIPPEFQDGSPHALYVYGVRSGAEGRTNLLEQCPMVFTIQPPIQEPPTITSTNPKDHTRGVPTYSRVSATFSTNMNPVSLNTDTFVVKLGAVAVTGSVHYLVESKVAVFVPAMALTTGTAYTATITTGAQSSAGLLLPENVIWNFTVTDGVSPLGGGMRLFFGDLHSHTAYSDGEGTPADAFATARANDLDFFAVTDHSNQLTPSEWQDIQEQANTATVPGKFVGLRGFEYTHPKGHINVLCTDEFVSETDTNYDTLDEFYGWLASQTRAIGQFNHPYDVYGLDWNFNDFAYNEAASARMCAIESGWPSGQQEGICWDNGWRVGMVDNSDTHAPTWGQWKGTGVLASNLTEDALLDAIRCRRTFRVSDRGYAVVMQANGHWMGEVIPFTPSLDFEVTVFSPDPAVTILAVVLYDNGVAVAADVPLCNTLWYTWRTTLAAVPGHRYYVKAIHDEQGWFMPALAGPIWVLDIPHSTDTDSDGLPAYWEWQYSHSLTNMPPHTDQDGDGADNINEFVAGTAPLDPTSFLAFSKMNFSNGRASIEWHGGTSVLQYVECATNLASTNGNWAVIATNEPPMSVTNSLLDNFSTERARFYRIRALR